MAKKYLWAFKVAAWLGVLGAVGCGWASWLLLGHGKEVAGGMLIVGGLECLYLTYICCKELRRWRHEGGDL